MTTTTTTTTTNDLVNYFAVCVYSKYQILFFTQRWICSTSYGGYIVVNNQFNNAMSLKTTKTTIALAYW